MGKTYIDEEEYTKISRIITVDNWKKVSSDLKIR